MVFDRTECKHFIDSVFISVHYIIVYYLMAKLNGEILK